MSEAIRRASRECPDKDGCFAFDRSRRVFSFPNDAVKTVAAHAYKANVAARESISLGRTGLKLPDHDGADPDRQSPPAGRPQFPADQPHPAPPGYAIHGLVQPNRTADRALSFDRYLAIFFRPRPERGKKDQVQEPA